MGTRTKLLLFIIVLSLSLFIVRETVMYMHEKEKILVTQFDTHQKILDSLISSQKEQLKAIAISLSLDPEVIKGYQNDDREIVKARMIPLWRQFQKEGLVNEVHFFKKPALSFVNMSNIDKFNIDVSNVRNDIAWVTSSFQSSSHIHICKTFTGIRATYPILVNNNVVGGVSIGKQFEAIPHILQSFQTDSIVLYSDTHLKNNLLPSIYNDFTKTRTKVSNYIIASSTMGAKSREIASLVKGEKSFLTDEYLVSVHPINGFNGEVIGQVLMIHPLSVFQEAFLNQLIREITIFLGTFILTLLLVYYYFSPLTRAISSLSQLTKRLTKRDFYALDDFTQLSITTNKELESLKRDLIEMGFSLKEHIIHQNEIVEAKTKELILLNHSLEDRIEEEMNKRHQQEHVLIERSKLAAMGTMINSIAHYWRQPLSVVNVSLSEIVDAYKYGELTEEHLEKMSNKAFRSIENLSKTIDNFRSFFKSDEASVHFDVIKSIKEAMMVIEGQMRDNAIEMTLVEENSLIFTKGFMHEFEHVCFQMLSNAKDALSAINIGDKSFVRRIVIVVRCDDKTVEVSFEDNAGGIPEAIQGRIFEPYFTTKSSTLSTGVGLFISRTIIENHFKGTLTFHNTANGVVFLIRIPKVE